MITGNAMRIAWATGLLRGAIRPRNKERYCRTRRDGAHSDGRLPRREKHATARPGLFAGRTLPIQMSLNRPTGQPATGVSAMRVMPVSG
jgi:hypothetical protein